MLLLQNVHETPFYSMGFLLLPEDIEFDTIQIWVRYDLHYIDAEVDNDRKQVSNCKITVQRRFSSMITSKRKAVRRRFSSTMTIRRKTIHLMTRFGGMHPRTSIGGALIASKIQLRACKLLPSHPSREIVIDVLGLPTPAPPDTLDVGVLWFDGWKW